jgi:DNA polymerase V
MTPLPDSGDAGCDSGESFALRVLGNDMAPEFNDGEIVIVEPEGLARDGSFVLARPNGEWMLRQLLRRGGGWALCALNADVAEIALADLSAVHGVVIQKAVPGRRRMSRFYR